MRKRWLLIAVALGVLIAGVFLEPTQVVVGWLNGQAFFRGRPTTYWSRLLRSDDPVRQAAGLEQLAGGGAGAVSVLSELLVDQRGSAWQAAEVRLKSLELLSEIGPDAAPAIPLLLELLHNQDPHVRSVAALALPKVGAPAEQAVEGLAELLGSDASLAAARALSEYGPQAQPAMTELVALLSNKELDSEIRWNAARTLGKLRAAGLGSLPVLIEHLGDEAATVREHSAEAIGDLGPGARDGVPALIAVLDDPATRVRRDAVRSLGYIGSDAHAALPAIQKLFKDPEDIVREAATTAWKSIAPNEPLPKE